MRSAPLRSTLKRSGGGAPPRGAPGRLRHAAGAAHDVAAEDTAFSYRDANWGAVYAGVDPDPSNVEAIGAWSRGYQEALHPYSAGGAYVNMMMEEGSDRVRASYRGNYDRLTCVKREYDPENLFSRTQNIPPADRPC